MSFSAVLMNVGMLVLLAVPAYVLKKAKKIDSATAIPALITILLFVCQPMLLANSFFTLTYSNALMTNLLWALVLSFVAMMLQVGLCFVVFRKKDDAKDKVYRFAMLFSNCGFFGLPLLAALFPNNSYVILYASVYIVVFNLLVWTVGIFVLTGDKSFVSFKKALLNPSTIATLVGLPFFVFGWNLPILGQKFVGFWATMTTPISMSIMGLRLAEMPLKEVFNDKKTYVVSFFRLVVAPLLMLCLIKLLNIEDSQLVLTMLVATAMPVATMTLIFAEKFTAFPDIGAKTVLCSTLLCVLTIPLISFLI